MAQPPTLRTFVLEHSDPAPTLPLMHVTFVLAGLGTMLLGPILPLLAEEWHLRDSQSGSLLLAQFLGATLGGGTLSKHLARDLLLALASAGVGMFVFAGAPGLLVACGGLLLAGFGIGRTIAAVNILAGRRATRQRGSALARLNFSWSFGALLSPLLAAWLTPHVHLSSLLAAFAACFLLALTWLLLQMRRDVQDERAPSSPAHSNLRSVFVYFVLLLFLYGGLETCLNGWLTTYALRFGESSLLLSEYTMVLLLAGLTTGRALASWLLLRMEDRTLLRIALAFTALLTAGLAFAHTLSIIAVLAVLLGIALAPVFPAAFALYMGFQPGAREAGLVLAASGLGAAALPWAMGVLSTRTGSLRIALALPVAAALAILLQVSFGSSPGPRIAQSRAV